MGQVGWIYKGKKYSLEEAVELAEKYGDFARFPPAALRRMVNKDRDPYVFSPSSAGYCLRQKILRNENDYYLDPDNTWSMSRGTAIHGYLDEGIEGQSEMHLKMDLDFGGGKVIHFAGTCDYYNKETKTLVDYKTTKTFFSNAGGKRTMKEYPTPEHELQTNLYAMLLRHHGMPVERILVWYVSASDGRKMVKTEVWDQEEVEEAAYNLASHLIEPKFGGILPKAYQPDDENYWQCRFCPVMEICRELEEKERGHSESSEKE